MIKIFLFSLSFSIVLFFLILYCIGVIVVKDRKLSFDIMMFEVLNFFTTTRKQRIEDYAKELSDFLRTDMEKIINMKDEDLIEKFSFNIDQVSKLKKQAEKIVNTKDCLLISLRDSEILLESSDQLSFIGSYKKSLDIFSDEVNRLDYNKMVDERRKHYQEIEENYNKKMYEENQNEMIKNIVNKNELQIC